MFAGEPLLEVTAPIAEAQLAETVPLNHITFQTGIASKAARCVLAARGAQLAGFSFRRTQGIEAGLAVARGPAIAGFTATTNTEAARPYGLRRTWPGSRRPPNTGAGKGRCRHRESGTGRVAPPTRPRPAETPGRGRFAAGHGRR